MRPSELKAATAPAVEDDTQKKYPSSSRADPPITKAETLTAPVSICRSHNGLVRQFAPKEGSVHFCPTGLQYWRHSKAKVIWRGLKYPRRPVI
jgi:hypothetical protein